MRKRVVLTTVVSFILLLAVILAGLNAIYTVTSVRADFRTYSADGESEARELQEKLDSFINSSTVFLDINDVQSVVDEYPGFRLDEVTKHYPDRIDLSITERKEAFSYLLPNGAYAILDEEGGFIYEQPTNVNRTGGENILLTGFDFRIEDGVQGDYFDELVEIFIVLRDTLSAVRANVLSVALVHGGDTESTRNDFITIQMREGVLIELYNPHVEPEEKARRAIECYANELDDSELVRGTLTVVDTITGDLILDYN